MAYKVLVAIDSTGLSELVTQSLFRQAMPEKTEILIVEVVAPILSAVPPEMSPGYQPEAAAGRKELRDRAKGVLDSALQVFRSAGFKTASRLVENEIKEGILQAATEWEPDLIVVTSHTRKGVAKFLHHSVAQAIVRSAPCSVLVLKDVARKVAAA